MSRRSLIAAFLFALAGCTSIAGLEELTFDGPAASSSSAGGGGAATSSGGSGGSGGGETCRDGYADCDGLSENGCEAELASDPAHCGSCDRSCGEGTCSSGRCDRLVLATGQGGPVGIAYRNGVVYWVNHETGQLMACAEGGCGSSPQLLGTSGYFSFYVAVNDSHVFWNNNDTGTIWRCPLPDGCQADVPWLTGVISPTRVGLDDSYLYWHSNDFMITRASLNTGNTEVLISNAGNHGDVYPRGSELFWTDRSLDEVKRCDISNGAASCQASVQVIATAAGVVDIDLDDTYVYFGSDGSGTDTVSRVPHSGGLPELLVPSTDDVSSVAVTDTNLAWVENETAGRVLSIAKDGNGPEQVLDVGLNQPSQLAVGNGFLFVTVRGDGHIIRYALD